MIANNLTPFWQTHPGGVLKDEGEACGMSQKACRCRFLNIESITKHNTMRNSILALFLSLVALSAMGQKKLAWGTSLGWGYCDEPSYFSVDANVGARMGYHLLMGGGLAVEHSVYNELYSVPLFVNIQGLIFDKPSTPWVEARLGFDIAQGELYVQPSAGYRFPLRKECRIKGLRAGLAYTWVNESHDALLLKFGLEF